ncbi:MAG: DUF2793 domain-containing protein [Sphingomonas sp.]|nr:DUF2793 domain-containing protein [Sphingomonas sp.]
MLDETTPCLALPLLQPGQAQKELYHNEALTLLDLIVPGAVRAIAATPPAAPQPGEAWIVAAGASGAWSGRVGAIAGWTGGGWRFVAPREGLALWLSDSGVPARYRAGAWTTGANALLGGARPTIAAPSGGGTADTQARATLAALLAALAALGIIAT